MYVYLPICQLDLKENVILEGPTFTQDSRGDQLLLYVLL